MSRRHLVLLQILLFLLVTLLGVATNYLTNNTGDLPSGIKVELRWSLPLAGISLLLIIGLMVWQHIVEERLGSSARPEWEAGRSPFPGLEAFTEHDSAVFFGRSAEITELLERLNPIMPARANRLITVVGPSGVGKSSLIQAGLVPRLRQSRSGWIVLPTVVPEDRPLWSLARCLAAAGVGRPTENVWSDLRTNAGQLSSFLEELRAARGGRAVPVLLVMDQSEELITLAGEDERKAILGLLVEALEADPRLWIILIMRSEFLTPFLDSEQARLFRDPVAVGALGRAALLEVIEQPARRAGLTFDPPVLVQRMAAEAGTGHALPLLAYALQELFLAAGAGGIVTADAYERIGGVTGVLTRQADKVTAELRRSDMDSRMMDTLLKFVTIGENEPTRRRVRRSTLTDLEWRVVEAFIAARLLTSDTDGEDVAFDVAHEALFGSWVPLRQAIEACEDQLRWRADLERWAMDWENSGRRDSYLLSGGRLTAAQRWADSDNSLLAGLPLVEQFLACSSRADRATMQRLSESIARQALSNLDYDPDYSLLLALAAFEDCVSTPLACRALTAALVASHIRTVIRGHDDWVWGVAWSPDGQRLATGSGDRTARIWNTDTGAEVTALRGHEGWVFGVAWSPDGQRLATASADGTARVWDIEAGAELIVLSGHEAWVYMAEWSPDGQRLATASADHTVRIWDGDSAQERAVLRGHNDEVRSVGWSLDGNRLATGSSDRTARIWSTETGDEVMVLRGHDDIVRWVVWSPDAQRLATGSSDRTIRIWSLRGEEIAVLRGHDGEVRGIAWSPDGRRLATASADRTVRIWDLQGSTESTVLRGHEAWIWGLAWSPDGSCLATASDDQTVRIWNVEAGAELAVLRGHEAWVQDVTWSPDGRRVATTSNDRTARIWNPDTEAEPIVLHGHEGWVQGSAWSPDGQRLATASDDETARIWDANTGDEIMVLRGHNSWVRGVAWSPHGNRLATVGADWTVQIWPLDGAGDPTVLRGHADEVSGVAWSSDGSRLATVAGDRTARIWNPDTETEPIVLLGHEGWVRGVAWSPDGRRLATVSGDRTARVWNANSGTELMRLEGHEDEVRGVAWSPDGSCLATVSDDRTIRIWNSETGTEIVVIGAHARGVESVSWSPDGRRIASASQDGTSRVWDATVSIDELLIRAHDRVSRELSNEERRNLLLPPAGN